MRLPGLNFSLVPRLTKRCEAGHSSYFTQLLNLRQLDLCHADAAG
jgi:hypothetical protein